MIWKIIVYLWPWKWLAIVVLVSVWVFIEIKTRFGSFHYNSENGFSPSFNRFVGSGSYLGLQTLLFVILKSIFGSIVYCFSWSYALHTVIFISTGILLNISGFWPYLKEPGSRRKRRYKR
jgi:hypothetical protein